MSSATYNLTATVVVPANAECPSTSSLIGSASSQGVVPAMTLDFFPVRNIDSASTTRVATLYASLVLSEAAATPPAQITAAVTFYGPPKGSTDTNYSPVGTPTVTAQVLPLATSPTGSVTSASSSSAASSSSPTTSTSASSASSSTNGTSTTPSSSAGLSTSSPTSPSASSSGKNYGAGAVAGAAVGCAIGGILIGCLIAFLLLKRRRRNSAQRSGIADRELAPSKGHGEAIYLGAGSKGAWASHLPQPESDGTIRSAASRTLDQIEMHIENFYVDKQPPHLSVDAQSAIEDFDSPRLSGPVLQLLPTTNRPTLLLKHCLTNLVLSRIDTDVATPSFLPRYMTGLQTSPAKRSQPGFSQALSQWRVLSSYLRQPPENDRSYLTERDPAITIAAKRFCQAFEPWARSDESTRVQNLTGIMKRASELGILIASQPSSFHWQWDLVGTSSKQKGVTQIVVLPGLYKVTDQDATPLSPPLHLSEPRVEPLSRP